MTTSWVQSCYREFVSKCCCNMCEECSKCGLVLVIGKKVIKMPEFVEKLVRRCRNGLL